MQRYSACDCIDQHPIPMTSAVIKAPNTHHRDVDFLRRRPSFDTKSRKIPLHVAPKQTVAAISTPCSRSCQFLPQQSSAIPLYESSKCAMRRSMFLSLIVISIMCASSAEMQCYKNDISCKTTSLYWSTTRSFTRVSTLITARSSSQTCAVHGLCSVCSPLFHIAKPSP